MPTPFLFTNFFVSELVSGVGTGDLTLSIPPVDSAKMQAFTVGQFIAPLVLWDGQQQPEIVWCTANPQTGALTVLRGQESTSAANWGAGTQIRSTITASVLNAALAAYNTGLILILNYLPLTGGTLTGPLTLSGLPTTALMAATKSYVDGALANYLPLSGGNLSGNLSLNGNKILQIATPTASTDAANKGYIDGIQTGNSNKFADQSGILLTTGTGLAYALATTAASYTAGIPDGTRLCFRLHATNRLNPTLAVDGTAAINIKQFSGQNVPTSVLPGGSIVEAEYRAAGPEWIIVATYLRPTLLTTGGTLQYLVTTNLSLLNFDDGVEIDIQLNATNTGAMQLNVDGLGFNPVRPAPGVEFASGGIPQWTTLPLRWNAATVEWLVRGAPPQPVSNKNFDVTGPVNLSILVTPNSPAGNRMTINFKQADGSAPTASQPVQIPFGNPSGTGDTLWRSLTADVSLVTSVGDTLGVANNIPFRMWVLAFDNNGSIVPGILLASVNTGFVLPINEGVAVSTSALGGAATSVGVFYTQNALASKCFRIVGFLDFVAGLVTAGSYNVAPIVRMFTAGMKKPGDIVQAIYSSGSSVVITPTTPINQVRVVGKEAISLGASAGPFAETLKRGATVIDTCTVANGSTTNTTQLGVPLGPIIDIPQSSGAVTYSIANAGGAATNQIVEAQEIMS